STTSPRPWRAHERRQAAVAMIAGVALLLAALVARTTTINRYVQSRLLISALLFGGYAIAGALVAFGRLPAGAVAQVQNASPLLLAFGLANAIVVLVINPWRSDRIPERFPTIVQDTIVIALFAVAAMLFLPDKIVATTAVGAVVIGFALQDTLGNLFAGLAIQIEKPFRVGHWVTIGGKDGLVSDITWRATKIRTKTGNVVVVPNSVLSRDTITNYSEPTRETQLEVQLRAGYDVPPNAVKAAQGGEGRRREGAGRRADDPGRASGGGAGGRVRRVVDRVPRPGVDHGLRRGRSRARPRALARVLRLPARRHCISISGADAGVAARSQRASAIERDGAGRRRDPGVAHRRPASPARGDVAAAALRRRRNDRAR